MTHTSYSLFTDGGSRGNPGKSAGGIVLKKDDETIFSKSVYFGIATNNQAEYNALIEGLKSAKHQDIKDLKCFLDSELIVKQLKGEYRVKDEHLKPLFATVCDLRDYFDSISFSHVRREKNAQADALVNRELDKH